MMEMNRLTAFYIEQYEKDLSMRKKGTVRFSNVEDRAYRLRRVLHTASARRISYAVLEDYQKQVRNILAFGTWKQKSKIVSLVYNELLPDIARLNVGLLAPAQQDEAGEDFLEWLAVNRPMQVCTKPLFMLYPAYKEEIIREQMTGMVPTRPEMEFPEALEMQRKFILHIGPTNSGKTYRALERLKTAENGIYLGPLRLLALEVYERMHDMNVPASMLTGQECITDEGSRVTAATVEMADLDVYYDIAVIDEAQLMADPDRGHSWTRAILGLKAREIHVCASPAAREVLEHLIDLCHDTSTVYEYERKTDLVFEREPFQFPDDVRQGDALIVFSKKSVLDVAGRLEESGVSASVIYGSLPPEIRRRQMHLFTEGETRVIVSTDAIGMGLNLPVRRIVFLQVSKYDGIKQRLINTSEVRQIAGRAGRYGIYDTGYITSGDAESLEYLSKTYEKTDPVVRKVNLGFPQVLLDIDQPLDEILKVWHAEKPIDPFEKENVDEALFLYEKAYRVRNRIVDFDDKHLLYRMISTPVDIKDRAVVSLWLDYCTSYTADTMLKKPRIGKKEKNGLAAYETYYKQLDLYYQMSMRLGKVMDEKWVRREREKTENTIMRYLLKDKADYIKRCSICGKILPIDYPYRYCERCWKMYD